MTDKELQAKITKQLLGTTFPSRYLSISAVRKLLTAQEIQHQQDAARIAALEAELEAEISGSAKAYQRAIDEILDIGAKRDELKALLASHAETIRQLKQDNEELRARVDSALALPPTGSTASTDGR